MLNKLALRNAGRLWKDYLIYFLTLCVITALMFSFHSLLFSEDIYAMIHYGESGEMSTAGTMLVTFMSVSTAAILVIVAWLINYMTRFIVGKKEPGICDLFVGGDAEKANCRTLHERKPLSCRVRSFCRIDFRQRVTAGIIFWVL